MCNILTPIVQQSFNRQVARCEHGTLHLSWHAVTWSLSGRDFARLHAFIHDALRSGQGRYEAPPMVFGRSESTASQGDGSQGGGDQGGGNVTVWSGPAGLAFTAEDFGAFCSLLQDTHDQLARHPSPPSLWQTQLSDLN